MGDVPTSMELAFFAYGAFFLFVTSICVVSFYFAESLERAAIARKLSELDKEKAALLSRRNELHATVQRSTAT